MALCVIFFNRSLSIQGPTMPKLASHTLFKSTHSRPAAIALLSLMGSVLLACGGGGGGGGGASLPASKLPHSGITASQCYQAGSDTLVGCTTTGATGLNTQQDGMRANINALSYSLVPKASGGTYDKTECVKDNITGLIWEGKTASGDRAGSNTYTLYEANTDASNSYGYAAYVNGLSLCGFTDWRLPTVEELQTIVDYSVAYPGPTINTTWFPNTSSEAYWSSTPYAGNVAMAWGIAFISGYFSTDLRYLTDAVRLVRASP
ncbi:MAG: hypothetical protein RLZZ123_1921 [Pseudomonadota bacterium]